ncbi:hypothetical protein [Nocardia sp. NPDC051833]|uniref:hypothetical protein n=1 Tax=Nocardia sp. NPDC051833 TaxID=3155674 RepID=UPI00341A8B70
MSVIAVAAIISAGSAVSVQVKDADGFVWSSTPEKVATDPHLLPSPGDSYLKADDVTVGSEGRVVCCNPTVNGRIAGNLRLAAAALMRLLLRVVV